MITNYYYLIAGVLSILFAFTHALNGQTAVLPHIDSVSLDLNIKTTIFYVWHIVTIENLIFGIVFLFFAFYKDLSEVRFAAWVIASIIVGRWFVIFVSTLSKNPKKLNGILIDTIAIATYVGLIALGTQVI